MAVPEAEIATLLDQCSQDELASILQAIESDEIAGPDQGKSNAPMNRMLMESNETQVAAPQATKEKMRRSIIHSHRTGELETVLDSYRQDEAPTSIATVPAPVPPSSPPRPGNARRPVPGGYKRAEEAETPVSVGEMKRMLEEHSAGVMNEVRRLLPSQQVGNGDVQAAQSGGLSLEMLTTMLAQRDQEVKSMEEYLADLQVQLESKDQRVSDLGMELETAMREVRHRQLDLEFQQLKLEERVRTNAELEQAQRSLLAQVDEASLTSRHAALEADLGRKSPRSARVQGSLPWMLRKNRQPWERQDALTDRLVE